MAHKSVSMANGITNTWYVTFEVPRTGKPPAWRRSRATVTFQNEFEAKEFARTKVAEGLNVSAGTINPHLPKRTIAPTGIHRWLEENSSIK
jgi:hypothetical protein